MTIKTQFVLLSVVLFSAFMVLIPSIDDAFTEREVIPPCDPKAITNATITACINANTDIPYTEINDVQFRDDYGWAVGSRTVIVHTDDGGETWMQQSIASPDVVTTFNDVFFLNDEKGWAVGVKVIIYTTDSGTTWTVSDISAVDKLDDYYLSSVFFLDDMKGLAVSSHGVLLQSGDGGVTWTVKNNNLGIGFVLINFDDNANVYATNGAGGKHMSIDGGSNWMPITPTSGGAQGNADSLMSFCGQLESHYNIITGTDNADYLKGTSGPDLIKGLGGNDFIRGGAGDDCIFGGNGNDFIQGGAGSDTIHGDNGDDVVRTGGGDDTVYGGAGDDIINAAKNNGVKTFDGGDGDDMCIMSHGGGANITDCEIPAA